MFSENMLNMSALVSLESLILFNFHHQHLCSSTLFYWFCKKVVKNEHLGYLLMNIINVNAICYLSFTLAEMSVVYISLTPYSQ